MATAVETAFFSERMLVTPAMAVEWLNRNRNNRPLNIQRVAMLKKAIEDGTFALTHQGIAFYGKFDELADGQHRLAAIIEAGIAVEMIVSWGLTKDVVHAIDRGRPRSIANVLGFIGMPMSQAQVATCRALWQEYYAARKETAWNGQVFDTTRFAVFCDYVADAVDFAMPPKACRGLSHASVTAAISSAWFTQSRVDLGRFKDLLHGDALATDRETAAVRLREYLLVTRVSTGGTEARQELYFRACTALRAFLEGRGLSKLYCRPDARFPIPDCPGLDC